MTKLEKILKQKGIKQNWLAKQLGVSPTTISNWVHKRHSPQPKHIIQLCNVLEISVRDYLEVEV